VVSCCVFRGGLGTLAGRSPLGLELIVTAQMKHNGDKIFITPASSKPLITLCLAAVYFGLCFKYLRNTVEYLSPNFATLIVSNLIFVGLS